MVDGEVPASVPPRLISHRGFVQRSLDVLRCSEYLLYELIRSRGGWPQDTPAPPEPQDFAAIGSLDLGVFLFLICNPSHIDNPEVAVGALAYFVWCTDTVETPNSFLTAPVYASLDSLNLVAPDGGVAGTGPFEMFDQNWLYALFNLAECIRNDGWHNGGTLPLPGAGYRGVQLDGGAGTRCTVGLLSDWGTGSAAASAVMRALADLSPDSIIHLGDVYYSGTPTKSDYFYTEGEEQNRLLAPWPRDPARPCFTMNSNHEMYCGAQGLFDVALADPLFSHQQNLSVFVARVADWTILGLDSAFNSSAGALFLSGMLDPLGAGTASSSQVGWIRSLGLDPSRTIVLTHHNGFDPNCSAEADPGYLAFRAQLVEGLGSLPHAWFWGHVHNAIVYDRLVLDGVPVNALCRCIGNGALPYGVAAELDAPGIVWQAARTAAVPQQRLDNGYATLVFTIADDHTVETITENYYTTADTSAAYSATLYAAPHLDAADVASAGRSAIAGASG